MHLFRRLVFAQVLLGVLAFCIAERNPGMLLVAGALGVLSWYVVEGPSGRPLPQWVIHVGAFAAVGWLALDLRWHHGDVIVAMGHFTMWLQIVQLYGHKTNREYGLILVLSLLQMIGASILSVSIVFGGLLAVYSVLALFTVLLFQFKTTSDRVMQANQSAAPPGEQAARPKAQVGRGHRWQFRLTAGGIGALCAAVAVVLFIVLPRSSRLAPGMDLVSPMVRKLVGFSDQVRLDGAPSPGSHEPVLNLAVSIQGRNEGSELRTWLLRGAALDEYDPQTHTWTRSQMSLMRDVPIELPRQGITFMELPEATPVYEADITLRSNQQRTLFTLYPFSHLSSANVDSITFNPYDQQVSAGGMPGGAALYHLTVPMSQPEGIYEAYPAAIRHLSPGSMRSAAPLPNGPSRPTSSRRYAYGWTAELPRIRQLTLQVLRSAGLQRDPDAHDSANDELVARALAEFLRTKYQYSLDVPPPGPDEEPIATFLFDAKKGHCELFASALAAMARSVGMRARVITGYLGSEYNHVGGYYIVRESDAHAWTEIYCSRSGWRTFDASPPEGVAAEHRTKRTWLTGLRELYEHLEFAWISSFIAYDKETRQAVLQNMRDAVTASAADTDTWFGRTVQWFRQLPRNWRFQRLHTLLVAVTVLLLAICAASLARMLIIHRRRLAALQLNRLPASARRQVARQLKFYLAMLDLLERHGHSRPPWQSPQAFARQLADADAAAFTPVVALTEQFYAVRFGQRPMSESQTEAAQRDLKALEANLAG